MFYFFVILLQELGPNGWYRRLCCWRYLRKQEAKLLWMVLVCSKSFRCGALDGFGLRLFWSKSFHCVALECLVEVFEKAVNQSGCLFKGFFGPVSQMRIEWVLPTNITETWWLLKKSRDLYLATSLPLCQQTKWEFFEKAGRQVSPLALHTNPGPTYLLSPATM